MYPYCSLNPILPEQAPLIVKGFYVKFSPIIYLDFLGSLACLLSFCNELEQIHLRRDMKCLEVGCLDQISDTCDPICRLSKYPFVSTFYGAYLKAACGTRGTGSNEKNIIMWGVVPRCIDHGAILFPSSCMQRYISDTYILSQCVDCDTWYR